MTTWLHEQRLEAVRDVVVESGARSVLDLGCGDGDLLLRLAGDPRVDRIIGIDICGATIDRLRRSVRALPAGQAGKIDLQVGSMTELDPSLRGVDCAVLVETIEHVDPALLSALERSVFHVLRPRLVVVTTPNAEFNPLLGVPSTRFRHPDHRFEWPRWRFRRWSEGAAARARYGVELKDVGGVHPTLGGASQMAVFRRPSPATGQGATPPRS